MVVLHTARVKGHDFPDWSMGFHNLGAIGVPAIDGYSRFLESPLSAAPFAQTLFWRKSYCWSFSAI